MWLRLAFIKYVSIFFTWDKIYAVYFTTLCIYYPQNHLGYFVQGQFHLPTTQMFLRRQGIKLERLLGFENFQIITHGYLVYPILGKYMIFHFGQDSVHQRNFQFILEWLHMLFLDTSLGIISEYCQFYMITRSF